MNIIIQNPHYQSVQMERRWYEARFQSSAGLWPTEPAKFFSTNIQLQYHCLPCLSHVNLVCEVVEMKLSFPQKKYYHQALVTSIIRKHRNISYQSHQYYPKAFLEAPFHSRERGIQINTLLTNNNKYVTPFVWYTMTIYKEFW